MKLLITTAAAVLLLPACDSGGEKAETPAAPAAAAPAPAAEPAAPSAADLEREKLQKMAAVAPDEATFSADCVTEGKLDKTVCDCVGQQTVKTLGAQGLYRWVWQGYVNRDGTAQMRSRKWFGENNIDKAAQQKFADAVGTCYVAN